MGRKQIVIDIDEVERLASIGLNEAQVADSLGISVSTLGERKKHNSDFYDALKKGQASGVATVANNLYTQSAEGNVSAGIFFMKNRAGWKDKTETDINLNGINLKDRTTDELLYFKEHGKFPVTTD